jgi:hypothetical protein
MFTLFKSRATPGIKHKFLSAHANEGLQGDKTRSQRLHEATYRTGGIDPMTGADIDNPENHPPLVDGNLVIYFESESTRKACQEMPVNHPIGSLSCPAADQDDRGG